MVNEMTARKDLYEYVPAKKEEWAYLDRFFALLAEENLTVVRASVPTASINMHTRVITIPNYAVTDKDVFLVLGSHEVSHALNTPREWAHDEVGKIRNGEMRDCINIVEDIRIEKLIRNKFPGFVGVYQRGYRKLMQTENFSTDMWDLFNICDRVNAKAKLGSFLDKEMTQFEESVYRYVTTNLHTFKDTLRGATFLHKILKMEDKIKALQTQISSIGTDDEAAPGNHSEVDQGYDQGDESHDGGDTSEKSKSDKDGHKSKAAQDAQKALDKILSDAAKSAEEDAPDEKDGAAGVAGSTEGKESKTSKSKTEKHLDNARKQSVDKNECNEFMVDDVAKVGPRRARWMSASNTSRARASTTSKSSSPLSKYY
jgi:hypothetical protein